GVLGMANAYYGCVEAQGQGTLHCHMLIWLEEGLNPNEIKECILRNEGLDFKEHLLHYLKDTISTCIPENSQEELLVFQIKMLIFVLSKESIFATWQFIGSKPAAKAILYYITDYIMKLQLKTHIALAAMAQTGGV
ncbi:hypothetical protein BDR06DRAFT_877668, partial [Suillus hirtellus]